MDKEFELNVDKHLGQKFSELFPDLELYKFEVKLREGAPLCAFCCCMSTGKALDEKWKSINSSVSAHSLDSSKSEFERWNSYLIFVCDEAVEKSLKYEIENDKFAMRKLLIPKTSDWDDSSPEKSLIELLNQRLLLSHIDLSGYKSEDAPVPPALSKWGKSIVDQNILFDRKDSSISARAEWIKESLASAMSEASNED